MSRAAAIHPEIWHDWRFAGMTPWARLLLLGLIGEADDDGEFEWHSFAFKFRFFPGDDVTVDHLLGELLGLGHIVKRKRRGKLLGKIAHPLLRATGSK